MGWARSRCSCSSARRRRPGHLRAELLGGNEILLEHNGGRFVANAEAIYSYEGTREMKLSGEPSPDRAHLSEIPLPPMPEHIDRRRYSIARLFAVTAVGGTVAGWGGGQYPWMLVDQLTIDQAVGADTTLAALLVVVALAVVIVLPAFGYLLRLTQTDRVEPNLRTSAPH